MQKFVIDPSTGGINWAWNYFINAKYQQLLTLQKSDFKQFQSLGNFVIALTSKNLNKPPFMYYLSPDIVKSTEKELLKFMNHMLKTLLNEPDLTWSLVDAVDILHITGKKNIIDIFFYNFMTLSFFLSAPQ